MESFNLTKSVQIVNASANVDVLYGTYETIALACAEVLPVLREKGRTVGIIENGSVVEYWWKSGVLDSDLVKKIPNNVSKTSELDNDGETGEFPFITAQDIPFIPSIAGLATVAEVNNRFTAILNSVPSDGDTLNKLNDKIISTAYDVDDRIKSVVKDGADYSVTQFSGLGIIVSSYTIKPNTYKPNDFMRIYALFSRQGTGSWGFQIFSSTTINAPTNLLANSSTMSTGTKSVKLNRNYSLNNGLIKTILPNTYFDIQITSVVNDGTIPFDTAVTNFITIIATSSVATDTIKQEGILITN